VSFTTLSVWQLAIIHTAPLPFTAASHCARRRSYALLARPQGCIACRIC